MLPIRSSCCQLQHATHACRHCVPQIPDGQSCKCGAPWADLDPVESGWMESRARLKDMGYSMHVEVYYRLCNNSDCTERLRYVDQHDFISTLCSFTYKSVLPEAWCHCSGMIVSMMAFSTCQARHSSHTSPCSTTGMVSLSPPGPSMLTGGP
jgi:hypothetical protein